MRIMIIGPIDPPMGGPPVLLRYLGEALSIRSDVELLVVDTCRGRPGRPLIFHVYVWLSCALTVATRARQMDIVTLHASSTGVLRLAPIVHIVSRLFRKPWALRVFGGNFDRYYATRWRFTRFLLRRTALSADVCLFQTQSLVNAVAPLCRGRACWYPNCRPMPNVIVQSESREHCSRFVFVGIVKPSKGILELAQAARGLPSSLEIDVYGPLREGITAKDLGGIPGLRYRGVLDQNHVIATLEGYDALVLPTYYEGEGYPGVILEAYAAGLPVIATRWRSIPELVDETTGILVSPADSEELAHAILRLHRDRKLYMALREGVRRRRDQYSLERTTALFMELCAATTVRPDAVKMKEP